MQYCLTTIKFCSQALHQLHAEVYCSNECLLKATVLKYDTKRKTVEFKCLFFSDLNYIVNLHLTEINDNIIYMAESGLYSK